MRATEIINIKNIIGDKWPTNPKTLALVDFIRNGGKIHPIKVIKTNDGNFILRDGRHRVLAFKLLGIEKIEAKFSTEINRSNNIMKNLEQFKALILKYESINESDFTDEQIATFHELENKERYDVLNVITGFGRMESCSLCVAVTDTDMNVNCDSCVYRHNEEFYIECSSRGNKESYKLIQGAASIKDLLIAYKARALHMRGILKSKNIKF